eukprot:scaffold490945_cov55-Attheya_sp.AAC.1
MHFRPCIQHFKSVANDRQLISKWIPAQTLVTYSHEEYHIQLGYEFDKDELYKTVSQEYGEVVLEASKIIYGIFSDTISPRQQQQKSGVSKQGDDV